MKILVIGGGAREHALAWKLVAERGVTGVICAPGNPGIAGSARCIPADVADPRALLNIAIREQIDLTVVGPELPLSVGICDAFAAAGQLIVGPSRAAAALEWSKAFAKAFMERHCASASVNPQPTPSTRSHPASSGTRWCSRPTALPPARAS
jgi:phosphoribosylamine---glycine ligase